MMNLAEFANGITLLDLSDQVSPAQAMIMFNNADADSNSQLTTSEMANL